MDMTRQFYTKEMTIRVIGENGQEMFPTIAKDDIMGNFDYRAKVLPSIAGQTDIKKKQDMDLYQLLINMPFVDPKKLTGKILGTWGWSMDAIAAEEQDMAPEDPMAMGAEGAMPPGAEGEMDPAMAAAMGGGEAPQGLPTGRAISPDVAQSALAMLRQPGEQISGGPSAFAQMSSPINLLQTSGMPPTPAGVGKTSNPRGMNRGGKVNTNIPINQSYDVSSKLANRANNIQR
jgi:hypothetical protein